MFAGVFRASLAAKGVTVMSLRPALTHLAPGEGKSVPFGKVGLAFRRAMGTRRSLVAYILAPVAILATFATGCDRQDNRSAKDDPKPDAVARGKTLVTAAACGDCHTPMKFDEKLGMPVPQMDRMLSGHPEGAPDPASTLAGDDQAAIGPTFTSFLLPFGVVYSANITPDDETGLGRWTEAQFLATMRTGQHLGLRGRPVLPPMPWMSLRELSDDDLRAVWAYLHTVVAVKNRVPQPKVPVPIYAEITKGYDAVLAPERR
jgi:mono/diheme cytochrome c family protein